MATLAPLPIYPSAQSRKGFSASQLAQFHSNLSSVLAQVTALSPAKWDTPSTRAFVSSYANDAAQQSLEALIWEGTQPVKHDRLGQRVLLLAEKLASSPPGLEPRTLFDICVAFPLKITRLRSILSAALSSTPDLPSTFTLDIVPAFTSLLSPSQSSGLYSLRRTARCLTSLLRPSPPELVRPFAQSKEFIVALALAYDDGLTAISHSYSGMRLGSANLQIDDWERIWLEAKVDIVDAFHLIVTTLVQDVSIASGAQLAVEADRAFGIVFALLDVRPHEGGQAEAVPFLNRSLIADYQYAYELSRTLSSALRHASRDDARLELLESTLRSLDVVERSSEGVKDPGAFKLILRSSGIAPGTLSKTVPISQPVSTDKGKAKTTAPVSNPPPDVDLDLQVAQVLDILPDHSPEYLRRLLTHPSFPFRGSAERVIAALLDGTAPGENALGDVPNITTSVPTTDAPIERRNIFDQETMDLDRIHVGKKALDGTSSTWDREWMKTEILRRVEVMSQDSDEEEDGRPSALDVVDLDDDLDEVGTSTIKIMGDGEDSSDEEMDPVKPETILELAYIRDPKLFDRDAETRRSKTRADLKQQTGWTDEQIEGWRIMLERNPKKERILQKHEFSGNRNAIIPIAGGAGGQPAGGQRGVSDRNRNRGRGRGRGRGQGGGNGGGRSGAEEKKEGTARERAFKEKHKSSHRKRGHDKKMGKAGVSPSQ